MYTRHKQAFHIWHNLSSELTTEYVNSEHIFSQYKNQLTETNYKSDRR